MRAAHSRRSSRRSHRVVAGCALLAGISLAALALPRAVAGFLMLPGQPALARAQDREPVSGAGLARIAGTREGALAWVEDGRGWTDLALARLMKAERMRVLHVDADLSPIRGALERGLALAPLNPYAWSRLAYLEYAVDASAPRPAVLLPLAITTGPSERRLYLLRAELGMRLFRHLAPRDQLMVVGQIELTWRQDPRRTLAAARASGRLDVLRSALAPSPEQAEILEVLLARAE